MPSRVPLLALLCAAAFLGGGTGACTGARARLAPVPDGVELLSAHIEILGPG